MKVETMVKSSSFKVRLFNVKPAFFDKVPYHAEMYISRVYTNNLSSKFLLQIFLRVQHVVRAESNYNFQNNATVHTCLFPCHVLFTKQLQERLNAAHTFHL